jgi:hypothetical protein
LQVALGAVSEDGGAGGSLDPDYPGRQVRLLDQIVE